MLPVSLGLRIWTPVDVRPFTRETLESSPLAEIGVFDGEKSAPLAGEPVSNSNWFPQCLAAVVSSLDALWIRRADDARRERVSWGSLEADMPATGLSEVMHIPRIRPDR